MNVLKDFLQIFIEFTEIVWPALKDSPELFFVIKMAIFYFFLSIIFKFVKFVYNKYRPDTPYRSLQKLLQRKDEN